MDNNLQKFKSLVEIAKVEYQDELNRNSRLEEKVGKFLMVQLNAFISDLVNIHKSSYSLAEYVCIF